MTNAIEIDEFIVQLIMDEVSGLWSARIERQEFIAEHLEWHDLREDAVTEAQEYVRGIQATKPLGCHDCGRAYGGYGWIDAIVPGNIWEQINPTNTPGGGILCLDCISKRIDKLGLYNVPVYFGSGPLITSGFKSEYTCPKCGSHNTLTPTAPAIAAEQGEERWKCAACDHVWNMMARTDEKK